MTLRPEQSTAVCDRPPTGWYCSRPREHEGPCAARRVGPDIGDAERARMRAENYALRVELDSLRDQTVNAGRLREQVRQRLARIESGDYSVIEMAADMERLLAVQWSGKCLREGCQAGLIDEERSF